MKIATKTYYGLRAMVNLAGKEELAASADIAYEEDISESFLEKILQKLKQEGLILSKKGAYGGYALAREAKDVSVYDIFFALGEDIIISFCPSDSACPHQASCGTRGFLGKLEGSIIEHLKGISLSDLLQK